jgi:hypothetical protein
VAEWEREGGLNRGRAHVRLLRDVRHGHVHDGARGGGGYGVVGEADERDPLAGDRGREGQVRVRGWGLGLASRAHRQRECGRARGMRWR